MLQLATEETGMKPGFLSLIVLVLMLLIAGFRIPRFN
jgi:hypothetical protein